MKLFLAVTAYDHKVFGECADSVLKNCISLMKAGHTVVPYTNNDLYVDRSRNFCVKLFLETDCTDIVFVDSDLSFDDDAILKLVFFDRAIVAGAYPYKKFKEEYPVTLSFDNNMNCKDEETGLVSCTRIPTGLMRINRSVFEKMMPTTRKDERNIYAFFRTGMVYPDDPNWYGEDPYFCKEWVSLGGQLWLEPRINFTHYGIQGFSGNYHNYLMGREIHAVDFDGVKSGLPGWQTESELAILRYLASKSDSIVEVGCWKGRSTKELLESCKGTVYAVDHWQGTNTDPSCCGIHLSDVYGDFISNVGDYPNLKILRGSSVVMAEQFDGNKVDMVFIDAGHTYEEHKTDIESWLPKCRKIIAGHDYSPGFPGVVQAVDEKFKNINVVDSLWWVEL